MKKFILGALAAAAVAAPIAAVASPASAAQPTTTTHSITVAAASEAVIDLPALNSQFTSMVITGGGARSDAWCQIFADVLGIEIRRDARPVAVNVRGAGWIGAVGAGLVSFAEIPGLMRNDHVFEPTAANRATYDEAFELYRLLHKQLAPVYKRRNS